jgi:hypothetical protein
MRKILFFIIVGVGVILTATSVPANALTFDLNVEFSGATEPTGPTPWLTATFADFATNQVQLTMSASGLLDAEFVSEWYFNSQVLFITSVVPFFPIVQAMDGRDADGAPGHGFDIEFPFPIAGSDRFGAGETRVFILGATGLTASSFNILNAAGNFFSAAHVQGIGANDNLSGWVASPIPEPGTILLLVAGLAGLFGIRRFKFKKN